VPDKGIVVRRREAGARISTLTAHRCAPAQSVFAQAATTQVHLTLASMSGLLSRALRSPSSSSSLQQYASAQSLVYSELDTEAQQDELELSSGGDDSVHSINGGNLLQGSDSHSHSVADETLLFGFEESGAELNAVASAGSAHR
jgi:hypothetical protein